MDGSDGSSNTLRKEVFTSLFSRKSTLSDTDQKLQAFCTDSETQNSWDVNSFKVREAQSEGKSTNHINTNKTCIHSNTAARSEDCQREIITNSVLTSAGIHVTLTDYDAEFDTRSASTTDKLSEGKQDSQTTLITDRLIGDQPASKHHIEEPESNSTIDRLIASVTVRASPTDQLEPLGRLPDTGSEDEDERNLSSGCLTPSSGGETSSNLSVAEVERSHDARSDRGSTTSSLSTVIKRALSDKRHAHRSRTSLEEEDNSRLYQSDSYLPALRLQLDNQSPQDTPGHHHLARFTLPRPAGKSSVSFLNPPHTEARISRDQEPKHSGNSCESSPTNQSTDLEESVELKTSPPISPLTKGLHCSSLSMYLPPPSISSLNKMWHHSYSGDSLSSDKRGPDAGKLGAELSPHYDLAAKVILLGDYSVGKTSFLSTLSKAKDENGSGFCREYRPGELAEVVFKRQQKRAMIRVMDTGGQERYRSMTSSYYRGVHGCLLVFDVTREDTFNNIVIWHSDLLKYSTDQYVAAILVGTTSHPGERVISPERGLKMAESLGIPYMECSPEDASMTLGIVQRLTEKVIKFALRRSSFAIDIKPQSTVRLEEKKKKKFVCLC